MFIFCIYNMYRFSTAESMHHKFSLHFKDIRRHRYFASFASFAFSVTVAVAKDIPSLLAVGER